jgi:predicted phage tail protein
MIFTNSNIQEEGFSYASTPETERITSATVDYIDERDNYMQKSEYVEDSSGIREHGYTHKKIAGMGITRRGEAYRLAWHTILSRQLEREIVQFKTGLQGSYLRIGDVIDIIDNNKMSKHSGGRIVRVIDSQNIEIDIPASALSDVSEIVIELPVLSDNQADTTDSSEIADRRKPQYKAYAISARVGFTLTLNTALDVKIKQGHSWIVKENSIDGIEPKKYRIKQIKESSPMEFELSATEYVESKYKNIDSRDGIDIQA